MLIRGALLVVASLSLVFVGVGPSDAGKPTTTKSSRRTGHKKRLKKVRSGQRAALPDLNRPAAGSGAVKLGRGRGGGKWEDRSGKRRGGRGRQPHRGGRPSTSDRHTGADKAPDKKRQKQGVACANARRPDRSRSSRSSLLLRRCHRPARVRVAGLEGPPRKAFACS